MISVKANPSYVKVPMRCVACYGAPVTDHLKVSWANMKGTQFLNVGFPLCTDCTAVMRLVQPKGELHPGLGLRMLHGKLTDEEWERASRISKCVKVSLQDKGFLTLDKELVVSFVNSDFATEFESINRWFTDPKLIKMALELKHKQDELAQAQGRLAKSAAENPQVVALRKQLLDLASRKR